MGKEEIFNYVMETPGNTNPNVLRSLLDSSGELPPVTENDNGKVLAVENGAWAAEYPNKDSNLPYQEIPVTYDGTSFSTTITPHDIDEGYTVGQDDYPSFKRSSFTKVTLNGNASVLLIPVDGNSDGWSFQSMIFPLDNFGMVGKVGCLTLLPNVNSNPYIITLSTWDKGGKYVVTLTPTALDYSGTMDKTPQEITAAYNAGQKIVFYIPTMAAMVDADQYVIYNDNLRFGAKVFYGINDLSVLITIITSGVDDTQTYETGVYSLTPAS